MIGVTKRRVEILKDIDNSLILQALQAKLQSSSFSSSGVVLNDFDKRKTRLIYHL